MIQFTPTERFAAVQAAHEDLYFYSRWMFLQRKGYRWVRGRHHQIICDALMQVFLGHSTRLIINVPPRYSKTELAVINFITWSMGQVPDAEFIHTSYSARLATNNSYQARELIRSTEYREIFNNVNIRNDSTAKDEWRTEQGGCVYAVGSGGTITGYGAGKHRDGFGGAIIIDDPHKADETYSDVIRKGVIDWFQNTLESRKNSPDTPIILVMQRLHEEDLSGWLLSGGNGEKWDHVCLPALNDDETEALWPEKHSVEELKRLKKSNSYVFSGQMQQRPTPLGGGILKPAHFGRYKVLPKIEYRMVFADTAQKTKERNDYTVFECWGKGVDGNIYLIDLIRDKWDAPDLRRNAIDFWNKHKATASYPMDLFGSLRMFYVEDKSSGTGLIQEIKKNTQIPIDGVPRVIDKLTRLMDVVGYVESGRVFIPESAPWVFDFTAECESFTKDDSHPHDDQIDPMIDAINKMLINNVSDMWKRLAA